MAKSTKYDDKDYYCPECRTTEALKALPGNNPSPMRDNGGSSEYYFLPPDCKNLQDVIVEKDMCYTRGNIFKAAYRWGEKGVNDDYIDNLSYNLEKIKWFAEDMLARLYSGDPSNPRSPNYGRKRTCGRED